MVVILQKIENGKEVSKLVKVQIQIKNKKNHGSYTTRNSQFSCGISCGI